MVKNIDWATIYRIYTSIANTVEILLLIWMLYRIKNAVVKEIRHEKKGCPCVNTPVNEY